MVSRKLLLNYLEDLLKINLYQDYCPNGLQVEGKEEIRTIVTAVTISQEVLNKAIVHQADAILVHHGFFWKGEDARILGIKKQRLQLLLQHNINLIGYHLPLDAHEIYGNNILLAKRLGIQLESKKEGGGVSRIENNGLLCLGSFPEKLSGEALSARLNKVLNLNSQPFYIRGISPWISKVALCTGSGQDYLESAVALGAEAYITGEISECMKYVAKETGLHCYAAGHEATECEGIRSLGDHLAEKFKLNAIFILPS